MEVKRDCPICGTAYEAEAMRLKYGRQTTCSRACSYRLRATNKEHKVTLACSTCGRQFNRSVSKIKGKHGANFCSPACHYAGRTAGTSLRIVTQPYRVTDEGRAAWVESAKKTRKTRIAKNNYGHTDATRVKLSEQTARAISEGRIPVRSKLEDKVAIVLDVLGIPYIRQFGFRRTNGTFAFTFDFMLDANTALEVNGTFWHSDPRFFPDGPVHHIQKRNALKWAEKLTQASERGIRVIEVWEYDIKKSATEAVRQALGITL